MTQARQHWIHPALRAAGWQGVHRHRESRDGRHLLQPASAAGVDAARLARDLERELRGEVLFDAGNRSAYAHDSSNYRQPPLGVVVPRDADDVVAAVAICRAHRAPVVPRGCGTSLAGQTVNVGVVLDTSKHMRAVVDVDTEGRRARVQPGVVRDQLSHPLEREHRLAFAPDTSTHEYATFGGMIGNNSCGMHSVMAGRTSDNVEELEVLTYDGTRMRVGATSADELERIVAAGGRRGEIYAGMRELRDRHADEIRARYPAIPRRVSGYSLDELLPERGFHVARALTGSEGTLAIVLEATVRLVDSPPGRALLVLGYPEVFHAADHVPEVLEHGPVALEAIDDVLVDDVRATGLHAEYLDLLPDGRAWLLVEFAGDTVEQARERARECVETVRRAPGAPTTELYEDERRATSLWTLRESALGATAYRPAAPDAWEGWEDAAVPPARQGEYLRAFKRLLDRYGYTTAMYGHFGDGCIHCRIDFDLESAGGIRRWRAFMDEAADLVVAHGGSLSGEHGDGQQRGELLPKMFGERLVGAFSELKRIWDPEGGLNPHKVVDPYPIASNLRLGTAYDPPEPKTYFSYPQDGGSFAHATLRCVGAGVCRDTEHGTMCPSYMATLDEQHTTRGRARILFEMLEGRVIEDGFRSDDVHEALDLCLACKGCKGECPVNVDMATYKAEFLAKHYRRRLRPRSAYSMGLVMLHARAAARAPRLANLAGRLGAVKRLAGVAPERELPRFARETFTRWWRRRPRPAPTAERPPVVLFPDTFNDHFHPGVLRAAAGAIEAAGRTPVVPDRWLCCGRPLYDYGMLATARRLLRRLVVELGPWARAGVPIVGIEPSCVATFRDELPSMLPHDHDARRLSLQTLTLDELLVDHLDWRPEPLGGRALVHAHCHHGAVMGIGAHAELLRRLGLDVELLDSGCCGMAGSFGYEADHYDVSVAVGERRLLPAARAADAHTLLVADGFSCRSQVEQLAGRVPLHSAELAARAAGTSR